MGDSTDIQDRAQHIPECRPPLGAGDIQNRAQHRNGWVKGTGIEMTTISVLSTLLDVACPWGQATFRTVLSTFLNDGPISRFDVAPSLLQKTIQICKQMLT